MRFLGQINDLAQYDRLTKIAKDKFLSGNDSGRMSSVRGEPRVRMAFFVPQHAMVTPRLLNIPRSPE
jgi:hypothetical protein